MGKALDAGSGPFLFYVDLLQFEIAIPLWKKGSPGQRPRLPNDKLKLLTSKSNSGGMVIKMGSDDDTSMRWTNGSMQKISRCEMTSLRQRS